MPMSDTIGIIGLTNPQQVNRLKHRIERDYFNSYYDCFETIYIIGEKYFDFFFLYSNKG